MSNAPATGSLAYWKMQSGRREASEKPSRSDSGFVVTYQLSSGYAVGPFTLRQAGDPRIRQHRMGVHRLIRAPAAADITAMPTTGRIVARGKRAEVPHTRADAEAREGQMRSGGNCSRVCSASPASRWPLYPRSLISRNRTAAGIRSGAAALKLATR